MKPGKKQFYSVLVKASVLFLTLASGCAKPEPTTPPEELHPASSTPAPTPTAESPTSTPTPEPSPTQPAIIKNIEYGSSAKEQILDLYLPRQAKGSRPVVLMLHEGNGSKEQFVIWGNMFSQEGYAVVSSNYRGWPQNGYPLDVEDAFCALAWIHSHAAEYNFDTGNVFVLGHSSGGTLAAMLGVVDAPSQYWGTCLHELPKANWVQGVITFTGIFDYANAAQASGGLKSYAEALLGGTLEEKPETWADASAITWIDGGEPPFLVLHGGADKNIPPEQSVNFAQALENAGVHVELVIVPDADHYKITRDTESIETTLAFLNGLLRH